MTLGKVLKLYPTFSDDSIDNVRDLLLQIEDKESKLSETEEKCEALSAQLAKTEAALEKTQ